jgi:hypothetical protein
MNMPATPSHPGRNILVDLKPAFDGYAGIPQETRLLFRGLRQMVGWKTRGLIQHGGRRLRAGLAESAISKLDMSEQIYRLSRLVISVNERYGTRWMNVAAERADNFNSSALLRLQTLVGKSVRPTLFNGSHFPDFLWRTLFDKTLAADDKDALTMDDYLVLSHSRRSFHNLCANPARPSAVPRLPEVDTRGAGFFVAQTPFPGRVSPGTQLVVRYHDAVPIFLPHTIKEKSFHHATHFHALRSNIASGAKFVCVSEATRSELLKVFPQVESDTAVIHNMISDAYFEGGSDKSIVPQLARNRLAEVKGFTARTPDSAVAAPFDYVLMVSTLEPRKNHSIMLAAWEQLKYSTHPALKLVVVGSVGWEASSILRSFKPWIERGDLLYLQNVPSNELRALYQHAAATICPSVAEGFDFSGVEAMRCGCPVVASDIPVHREIYEDASIYFDPYSADMAADSLRSILQGGDGSLARGLIERGRFVSQRYLSDNILPRWIEFFESGGT